MNSRLNSIGGVKARVNAAALRAWKRSRQRRVGVTVDRVPVTVARGVPSVELIVIVGLVDGSTVAASVAVSRVGIRPWVGVRGTGPPVGTISIEVAVAMGCGGSVT